MTELSTPRLALRRWRDSDREPFAALNADPEVCRFLHAPLTREQSDAILDRLDQDLGKRGYGLWAVEVRAAGELAGFVGLNVPTFDAHFTPCVEVGWRLARHWWGHGIATDAGAASLDHAFGPLGLDEVVSMTVRANLPSQAVMGRLGMERDHAGDFEHPQIAEGDPVRPHVLYRIDAATWRGRT